MKLAYGSVRLETQRLVIRAWTPADADAAFAIYSNPEVLEFLCMDGVRTREQMAERLRTLIARREVLADGMGSFALELKDGGEVVGAILLKQLPLNGQAAQWDAWDHIADPLGHPPITKLEVGWHLRREYWGLGYATEAATEILRYGFEDLNLPEIWCVLNEDNLRSANVAQRLGLRSLGITMDYYDRELETFCQTKMEWAQRTRECDEPKTS